MALLSARAAQGSVEGSGCMRVLTANEDVSCILLRHTASVQNKDTPARKQGTIVSLSSPSTPFPHLLEPLQVETHVFFF